MRAAGAVLTLVLVATIRPPAHADSLQESLNHLSIQVHAGYLNQRLVAADLPPYLGELFATVERLFPEAALRLYLLRLSHGNASTLPDGSIYLRQGFLVETHTSEELIFVLAHEAAHVALEHVAGRCRDNPRQGLFSVEVEIEADQLAINRMQAAGIDTSGVHSFLQRLAADRATVGSQLASRVERIAPARNVHSHPPAALIALHAEALELLLSVGRVRRIQSYLATLGSLLEGSQRHYFEAELARRQDRFEDSLRLFRQSLKETQTAAAWRGLALTLEAAGQLPESRVAWNRVLELDPETPDGPLIRAFADGSCASGAPAATPPGRRRVAFGAWELGTTDPWLTVRRDAKEIVLSPDSGDLTRLSIHAEGPPTDCRLSPLLLNSVRERLRAHPGAVLTLESAEATPFGAVARLSYGDEIGVQWRVDLHTMSSPAGRFSARFRAPARHFHGRWAGDVEAILASIALAR